MTQRAENAEFAEKVEMKKGTSHQKHKDTRGRI